MLPRSPTTLLTSPMRLLICLMSAVRLLATEEISVVLHEVLRLLMPSKVRG